MKRLLLFLATLLGCCATVAAPPPLPPYCPSYVAEYAAFHREHRGSTAFRHLTLSCPPDVRLGGLGDRMRAVLYALRVAIKHRLLLFIDFEGTPFALEGRLAAAHIDWRPLPERGEQRATELSYARLESERALWRGAAAREFHALHADNLALVAALYDAIVNTTAHLTLCATTWHDFWHSAETMPELPGVGLAEPQSSEVAHCLWSALFAPSVQLSQLVDAQLSSLFGSLPPPRFAAIHLRLGGLVGEDWLQADPANPAPISNRGSPLLQQHGAHLCARRLARRNLSSDVLLVTDNWMLRRAAARGLLEGVVAPAGSTATHLGRLVSESSDEAAWQVWTELGMLASARCLVHSFSGFSHIARWWGGSTCVRSVDQCLDEL